MRADIPSPRGGRYLIFHLADRTYAISIADVEVIVPAAELSPVPGAPAFLAGFLDRGGELVAVLSLRRLWDMPNRDWELYSPLILLKASPRQVALEVDSVSRIVEVAAGDMTPVAEGTSLNNCAEAIARVDGATVVVLSTRRILLGEEERRVAELAMFARQRSAQMEMVTA